MYNIIPVNIPIVGEVKTLSVQVNPFPMKPGQTYSIMAYVTLRGENAFFEKNIVIPAEVTSEWVDDQIIIDYVVAQLGVELAPEVVIPNEEITDEPAEEPEA